jgi:hypothetical protein
MRTPLLTILAILAGQPTTPVCAQESGGLFTGNQFLSLCNLDREGDCLGYVAGVTDTLLSLQAAKPHMGYCIRIPAAVTGGQLRDIAVKYLQEHPEERHYTAASEVILAMLNAFPCK